MIRQLKCADKSLALEGTLVMGILNVTPDSFSDGGSLFANQRLSTDQLLCRAERMVTDGAVILDIGGESTRPNAEAVSQQQEMDRELPAIELLAAR